MLDYNEKIKNDHKRRWIYILLLRMKKKKKAIVNLESNRLIIQEN